MSAISRMIIAGPLALVLAAASSAGAVPASTSDGNADGNLTIFFGPDRYALPGDDLGVGHVARNIDPKHVTALSFMFLLPDMKPASLHPDEVEAKGWGGKVTVLMEYGRNFKSVKDRLDDYMKRAKLPAVEQMPEAGSCKTYMGDFVTTKELHLCHNTSDYFLMECATPFMHLIYPSCTILENMSDNSTAIITFGKQHLESTLTIERFIFNYLPSHKI